MIQSYQVLVLWGRVAKTATVQYFVVPGKPYKSPTNKEHFRYRVVWDASHQANGCKLFFLFFWGEAGGGGAALTIQILVLGGV